MFRLVVLVCLLVLVQSARFLPKPMPEDGRIVGGFQIAITAAPYQISLQYNRIHFCGGSLISRNYVLTAAHCTNGLTEFYLSVRIGSSQHASGGLMVNVQSISQHHQYNASTLDYDFSILLLSNYNSNGLVSGYVNLPNQGQDVPDGAFFMVSGWGETNNAQVSNATLRAVNVPKFNQADCNRLYSQFGGVTERMICAGFKTGFMDTCQGDSGGPLVSINDNQLGVVSWGYGCGLPNYPGVYSRVASVRDWIKTVSSV